MLVFVGGGVGFFSVVFLLFCFGVWVFLFGCCFGVFLARSSHIPHVVHKDDRKNIKTELVFNTEVLTVSSALARGMYLKFALQTFCIKNSSFVLCL